MIRTISFPNKATFATLGTVAQFWGLDDGFGMDVTINNKLARTQVINTMLLVLFEVIADTWLQFTVIYFLGWYFAHELIGFCEIKRTRTYSFARHSQVHRLADTLYLPIPLI